MRMRRGTRGQVVWTGYAAWPSSRPRSDPARCAAAILGWRRLFIPRAATGSAGRARSAGGTTAPSVHTPGRASQ